MWTEINVTGVAASFMYQYPTIWTILPYLERFHAKHG